VRYLGDGKDVWKGFSYRFGVWDCEAVITESDDEVFHTVSLFWFIPRKSHHVGVTSTALAPVLGVKN